MGSFGALPELPCSPPLRMKKHAMSAFKCKCPFSTHFGHLQTATRKCATIDGTLHRNGGPADPNPHHEAERFRLRARYVVMPTYRVIVVNGNFTASNDHKLPSLEDARKLGIRAALAIGADEVTNGTSFFGAEVRVEVGDETLRRFVVSVGASELQ